MKLSYDNEMLLTIAINLIEQQDPEDVELVTIGTSPDDDGKKVTMIAITHSRDFKEDSDPLYIQTGYEMEFEIEMGDL